MNALWRGLVTEELAARPMQEFLLLSWWFAARLRPV
jgi:hypothetical protein